MYNFTNMHTIGERGQTSSHQLVINGVNVDQRVSGLAGVELITLAVSGRGLAQKKHSVVEQDGIDGALFQTSNFLPRTLSVKVKIQGDNDDSFSSAFSLLNYLLNSSEIMSLSFTDEPVEYYGYFLTSSEPEDINNEQVVELNFYCPNPFKYDIINTSVEIGNGGAVTVYSEESGHQYDRTIPLVRPNFRITFPTAVKGFTLTMNDENKVLNIQSDTAVKIWDIYLDTSIKFPNVTGNREISKENLRDLSLDSDFADFGIHGSQRFTVQPEPSKITVDYKGVSL